MSTGCKHQDRAVGKILDFICSDWTPDAETRKAARIFILDSLGVGLSGVRVPFSRNLYQLLVRDYGNAGGVTAWGWPHSLSPAMAAMLNAYQIHNQEYDCVHEEAVVHPMAVILSSLLAFAEHQGKVNGSDFLTAVCLAVDVAVLLGVASTSAMKFFRPGICGALGATAGMARLARLSREDAGHALSIAYSQLGGTMQAHLEGSPVLPMQIAFNARNAVFSVEMAKAGLRGPMQFLQGKFGFYALFEESDDPLGILERLGDGEIKRLCHKPFPTGRAAQGVIDALLRLRDEKTLSPERISTVRVSAPPLICRLVDRPPSTGMDPGYARLCLSYIVARLIQRGAVDVSDFDPSVIAAGGWETLAAKVVIEVDRSEDPNALVPQQVEVHTTEGETGCIRLHHVLGSPDYPLSAQQQRAKLDLCLESSGLPLKSEEMIESVERISDLPCMQALTRLLKTG